MLKNNTFKEKRKYPRIEFGIAIKNYKNKNTIGFTTDLSANSCYLETPKVYPVTFKFLANFELPDSLININSVAEVVRISANPKGMGIIFHLNRAWYFSVLKKFIAEYSF